MTYLIVKEKYSHALHCNVQIVLNIFLQNEIVNTFLPPNILLNKCVSISHFGGKPATTKMSSKYIF